jgi:hypothetical protein
MLRAAIPRSYVWQVPGKHISVSLTHDVIKRMVERIADGGQTQAGRTFEIGGLLLGKKTRTGGITVMEIQDFEPLPCEHAFGPSYFLSATDRTALQTRLRGHKSSGGAAVMGFYRTHTRREFAATVEDVGLMSAYFSEPWKVFLIIDGHGEIPNAGFLIWEGRRIRSLVPYLTFPFSMAISGEDVGEPVSYSAVAPPASKKCIEGPMQARKWPGFPALQPAKLWAAIHKALLLRSLTAAKGVAQRAPHRLVELGGILRRRAHVPGWGQMRSSVKWLAASAILVLALLADIAHLGVTGPVLKSVTGKGAPLSKREGPPLTARTNQVPPALNPDVAAIPAPGLPVSAAQNADAAPPVFTASIPGGGKGYSERTSAVVRKFEPQSAADAAADVPLLAAAPEIAAANPVDAKSLLSWENENLGFETLPPPSPFVSVTIGPAGEPLHGGLLGKLLNDRRHRSDFVPPSPLHETLDDFPDRLRSEIKQEVPIDVRVYIDRTGKVQYAELLSNGTGKNRDLASLAVFSSRHWVFSPAEVRGEAVPAEVVLRFRFSPEQPRR